jgi:MFS family permease
MAENGTWVAVGNRELAHYPPRATRWAYLALVVLITVALYYALYVGGGVAPIAMRDLHISFSYLVWQLVIANLLGAFASLLAGASDRFGRTKLVVYGLLIVALLTAFAVPMAPNRFTYAALGIVVGFVEGIILVATPALMRDFSPQVGRATAMGLWAMGPVLGSLMTSAVISATLDRYSTWQAQFRICGAFCLVVFILAWLFLKELKPALRDQIMVSDRDRVLNELRARGLDIQAALRNPWRQVLRVDVVASAFGVSVLLLVYYTTVAFGVIYLVRIFGLTPARANALMNWSWGANTVALLAAGVASDTLRVRKPFMVGGGLAAAVMIWVFMAHGTGLGSATSFTQIAVVGSIISIFIGIAYAAWMASFTETIEAHNPALTATGLAVWGWILRIIVTLAFWSLPKIVDPVTSAAQWQTWFAICAGGAVVFSALALTMKGGWSPARARAEARAHDAAVARELLQLSR